MSLQSNLQTKIASTFSRLNASGKNLGGRLALQLQVWERTQAGGNPTKGTADLALVPDSEVDLIPIDTKLGAVRRFDKEKESLSIVGDVSLEVAYLDANDNALTREQLLGQLLLPGQKLRYLLGDEYYSVLDASFADDDGLSFRLALKRDQA